MRAVVCPHGVVDLRRELLPDDAPPLTLVRELLALGGDTLLVGHQPSVEQLVHALADEAGRSALPFGFRTAMIVGLQVVAASSGAALPLGRFRLRMVVDPREAPAP